MHIHLSEQIVFCILSNFLTIPVLHKGVYTMLIRSVGRREARGLVIGKATDIRIRASMRYANVFVSRLDPNVSCEDICAYLQDIIQVRPTIEAVKVTDHYSSLHITSECRDPSVFLDANIWPEGSLVRWWRHKKDPVSRPTSRVSSDTSDEHRVHTLM